MLFVFKCETPSKEVFSSSEHYEKSQEKEKWKPDPGVRITSKVYRNTPYYKIDENPCCRYYDHMAAPPPCSLQPIR